MKTEMVRRSGQASCCDVTVLGFCNDIRPGLGEDSVAIRPCALADQAVMIACLDGCGGSGARKYALAGNWTGAKIASRVCASALCDWFDGNRVGALGMQGAPLSVMAPSIKQALDAYLSDWNGRIEDNSSKILGSLSTSLPTTLAAAIADWSDIGFRCAFFWAGDSRCYLFTPHGLQQMSQDDVTGDMDAQENLERDGILTNSISATGKYRIHAADTVVSQPCMMVTATDGCFAYLPSPLCLEDILLETLQQADTPDQWRQTLIEAIALSASDDFSMQIAVLGFSSFSELKQAYRPRAQEFARQYGKVLHQAKDIDELRALWRVYKPFYESCYKEAHHEQ